VFRELTDAKVDAEATLRKYVAKRVTAKPQDLIQPFRELEVSKYEFLHKKLTAMLVDAEGYTELQWQEQILDIVRLLNPKYIAAFTSVLIKDSITGGRRQIDIMLVDANGNNDVIEIKKPFKAKIVTETMYRDNHVPHRELAGAVTQVEKYLFHLNRWGTAGEEKLTERYMERLPTGLKIRIVNPCGLIIVGRDNDLTDQQKADFEIFLWPPSRNCMFLAGMKVHVETGTFGCSVFFRRNQSNGLLLASRSLLRLGSAGTDDR